MQDSHALLVRPSVLNIDMNRELSWGNASTKSNNIFDNAD